MKCHNCKGRRFTDEVQQVQYEGFSISDLLNMSVQESLPILKSEAKIAGIIAMLYEPTTGLHPSDIKQLYILLNKLVDTGNTVIVVEHCLELIRESDWVIDIGPEGGAAGGKLVAEGTPEQIAEVPASYTGMFLKRILDEGI
ncbi:hypothetical protein [Paenibacillus sp. MER TA 81-3]|uniref:hypothetical protein n=1 Tax=Paenibacillus sp. MER TA 81-3 TaxID=2939573 RepID=UPI00203FB6CB|nr:hypothetical protein [Paenibacillus sp. MER TA 81-3]